MQEVIYIMQEVIYIIKEVIYIMLPSWAAYVQFFMARKASDSNSPALGSGKARSQ